MRVPSPPSHFRRPAFRRATGPSSWEAESFDPPTLRRNRDARRVLLRPFLQRATAGLRRTVLMLFDRPALRRALWRTLLVQRGEPRRRLAAHIGIAGATAARERSLYRAGRKRERQRQHDDRKEGSSHHRSLLQAGPIATNRQGMALGLAMSFPTMSDAWSMRHASSFG